MKVVVTQMAFVNGVRVRPGTEIEVPSSQKGTWFVPVASPEAKAMRAPKAPKPGPQTLSEMAAPAATTFNEAQALA